MVISQLNRHYLQRRKQRHREASFLSSICTLEPRACAFLLCYRAKEVKKGGERGEERFIYLSNDNYF